MNKFLTLCMLASASLLTTSPLILKADVINGGFEQLQQDTFEIPYDFTSPADIGLVGQNMIQRIPGVNGGNGVLIQNSPNPIYSAGFLTNDEYDFGPTLEGGVDFDYANLDTLKGYYQLDAQPGDSVTMILYLKGPSNFSWAIEQFYFTQSDTVSAWTPFAFPLQYASDYGNIDSLVFMVTTNAFDLYNYYESEPVYGTSIALDSLHLTSSTGGAYGFDNSDFEYWDTITEESLVGPWILDNESDDMFPAAFVSSFSYNGQNAVELENQDDGYGDVLFGGLYYGAEEAPEPIAFTPNVFQAYVEYDITSGDTGQLYYELSGDNIGMGEVFGDNYLAGTSNGFEKIKSPIQSLDPSANDALFLAIEPGFEIGSWLIVDDITFTAAKPTVTLNTTDLSVAEGESILLEFVISDNYTTHGDWSDDWMLDTLNDSSTTNILDYANIDIQTVLPGDDTVWFEVIATADSTTEGNEQLVLRLTGMNNYFDFIDSVIHITVVDSSISPLSSTVQFADTAIQVNENAGSATLTINLSAATSVATSVDVVLASTSTAINGADFTFTTPTTVTFPANTTSQTISVAITNDVLIESSETIVLQLSNASTPLTIGTSESIITILDDDSAALAINEISVTDINIYPNPVVDRVTIGFTIDKLQVVAVKVLNTLGQVIDAQQVESQGMTQLSFDVADMESGIYLIQVGNQIAKSFIKK